MTPGIPTEQADSPSAGRLQAAYSGGDRLAPLKEASRYNIVTARRTDGTVRHTAAALAETGRKRYAVLYAESKWEGYYLFREITALPEQLDGEYLPLLKELEGVFGLTMPALERLGEQWEPGRKSGRTP